MYLSPVTVLGPCLSFSLPLFPPHLGQSATKTLITHPALGIFPALPGGNNCSRPHCWQPWHLEVSREREEHLFPSGWTQTCFMARAKRCRKGRGTARSVCWWMVGAGAAQKADRWLHSQPGYYRNKLGKSQAKQLLSLR